MGWNRYDKGKGGHPMANDHVVIVHTNSDMDGKTGKLSGWVDSHNQIAIVILDSPYMSCSAVSMPVVCLKKVDNNNVDDADFIGQVIWQSMIWASKAGPMELGNTPPYDKNGNSHANIECKMAVEKIMDIVVNRIRNENA